MRSREWWLSVAGLCIVLIDSVGQVSANESMKERMLREAPKGWTALYRQAIEYQGKIVHKGMPTIGRDLQTYKGFTCDYHFKGDGDNFLVESSCREGGFAGTRIVGMNQDYGFSLKRSKADGALLVSNLDRRRGGIIEAIESDGQEVFLSVRLDRQTMDWSLKQPAFKILSVEPVAKNGRTVAEMHFESEAFVRPDYQIRSGTVILDPERSWAVLGYSIDIMLDAPAKVDAEITYADDGSNFPIPTRYMHTFRATVAGGPLERRETAEFSDVTKCMSPDSDFRLTAFGFPEPAVQSVSESGRGWYLLMGAGGMFLLAAVVLRKWASRRGAAQDR